MPWMNRICDDINPGLDIHEDESPSAPPPPQEEEIQLKNTDMPPPFNLVPLAPPISRPTTKKAPAPPPPFVK